MINLHALASIAIILCTRHLPSAWERTWRLSSHSTHVYVRRSTFLCSCHVCGRKWRCQRTSSFVFLQILVIFYLSAVSVKFEKHFLGAIPLVDPDLCLLPIHFLVDPGKKFKWRKPSLENKQAVKYYFIMFLWGKVCVWHYNYCTFCSNPPSLVIILFPL